jgi:hypothetical protein
MANSSILGGDATFMNPDGRSTGALGPSDSTDSGSDLAGVLGPDELQSDSDRHGTGERAAVEPLSGQPAADILPDHIEGNTQASDDDAAMREVAELDNDADTDPGIDHEVAQDEGADAALESRRDIAG